VRGAEVLWNGGEEHTGLWIDKHMPAELRAFPEEWKDKKYAGSPNQSHQKMRAKAFLNRSLHKFDGAILFDKNDVDEHVARMAWARHIVGGCMELEEIAKQAADKAESAVESLHKTLESFRGKVKNDVTSIKAAAERVQDETARMRKNYECATSILNSPEFVKAVENAERMAAALEAIARLQQTKIAFAVFGEPQH
jgi:hypothetical protein